MPLKNYKRIVCGLLFAWIFVLPAQGLNTEELLPAGPSKTLLKQKKPIRAEMSGVVQIPFARALEIYAQPGLIENVQHEYGTLLADHGTPEFTIHQSSTNSYFYINRNGQRTDLIEVVRRPASDLVFDVILYTSGTRFFGFYEAVIHVQLTENSAGETRYDAVVYAYPENALSRFLGRRLHLVERYFKKKTRSMSEIICTISCGLCRQMDTSRSSMSERPTDS